MNDNEQRDELAQVVMSIAVHPDLLDYRGGDYSNGGVCLGDARRIASKALAAGYRKPRTITTVEELDALPKGVVIHSSEDGVFERGAPYWRESGSTFVTPSEDIALPATVIHEPTTEATK